MPKKINATKTLNPLHFEDLEPHRFEDLVRRLLYSFRDWRDIEATGRSGSDEGFDIRAWEKTDAITNVSEEGEEGEHLAEGNLWQVQGKREKSIGPSEMKAILENVDEQHPPYGYILAAATNISKKTYDTFREELRRKGVREFYYWGKDHLEDQLALPENDEILFTFFGISLSPRRRSRAVEIKFSINNKNKILKMLFDKDDFIDQGVRRPKSVLLRDMKDGNYPDKAEHPDFNKHPRWGEYEIIHVDAVNVCFKAREFYAYVDREKKEWGFTKVVDIMPRNHSLDEVNDRRTQDIGKKAESYWRHLPQRFQAKLMVYGFVPYEDILIIDDRGDPEYAMPHLFLDYHDQRGPFAGQNAKLVQKGQESIWAGEFETQYKKITIFPGEFPEPTKGTLHEIDKLGLTGMPLARLQNPRGSGALYSFDGKLDCLSEGDLIHIPTTEKHGFDNHVEITHIRKTTVAEHAEGRAPELYMRELEEYAGRKVTEKDQVTIYEIIEVFTGDKYLRYYDHEGW